MTIKIFLKAPRSEAERIADRLEQVLCDDGAAIALSEDSQDFWSVEAYLESDDPAGGLTVVRDALGTDGFAVAVNAEVIQEKDWVSESLKNLPAIRAGRFVVRGSHLRAKPVTAQSLIEIDAGQAFGTGHHGTTAGCLTVLDRVMNAKTIRRPLDIGTGTGVLAIALAKRLHKPVVATDIDPIAVGIAQENARKNNVSSTICLAVANGTRQAVVQKNAPYDLIVANILAGPLIAMAGDLLQILDRKGVLILSGLLPHQRSRVTAAFVNHGAYLQRADQFDKWSVLTLSRP